MTFTEKRRQIGEWLREEGGGQLWDLMCALRGPDSPSERVDMPPEEYRRMYAARRRRKHGTVEVIRQKAFFGVTGGCARHHDDDHIILPPVAEWDHFDHHMSRAARIVGVEVKTEDRKIKRNKQVEVMCD